MYNPCSEGLGDAGHSPYHINQTAIRIAALIIRGSFPLSTSDIIAAITTLYSYCSYILLFDTLITWGAWKSGFDQ